MIASKQIILINNRQISPRQVVVIAAALDFYEDGLINNVIATTSDLDIETKKHMIKDIYRIQEQFID